MKAYILINLPAMLCMISLYHKKKKFNIIVLLIERFIIEISIATKQTEISYTSVNSNSE